MLAGYAVLGLLFSWELILPGRSLFQWDTILYNWPVLLEARAQLLAGHLPFWASSFCCGTPLLENINAGVLYPVRLLCWLLPLRAGYHAFLFFHVWASFVGMHVLLRRGFRLGPLAAFVGALAFGASGYARSMWDTHNFMPLPWIPLAFAALLEVRHGTSWKWGALATGLCWSMMILGGDFQAACLWLPFASLLALAFPERRILMGVLASAALLALLLTAPQWLTAAAGAVQSYRSGGLPFNEATQLSFHPLRLVELVIPLAFGSHSGGWFGAWFSGPGAVKTMPWLSSFHIGVIPFLAAFLAFRRWRRPAVIWAVAVLTASVALSFGQFLPGFEWWLRLPVAGGFRYPQKYLLWSTAALAVLAGFGTSSLQGLWQSSRRDGSRRRLLLVWILLIALGSVAAFSISRAICVGAGASAWVIARAAAAGLVALALAGIGWRPLPVRPWLVLLLVLDSFILFQTERPTTCRYDPLDPPAVVAAIRDSDSASGRFLRDRAAQDVPAPPYYGTLTAAERVAFFDRESLSYNSPRVWGVRSADGFSPLESAAMRTLRTRLAVPPNPAVPSASDLAEFCRLSGVEWLLTTRERSERLKKAGLVGEIAQAWSDKAVLFRIRNAAESEIRGMTKGRRGGTSGPVIREMIRLRPGGVRIDLEPGPAAQLVVKETFSKGWKAEDESGQALDVSVADEAFLGVSLRPGTTQVRLTYRPVAWIPSLWPAAAGVVLSLLLVFSAIGEAGVRRWICRPWVAALCGSLLFVLVGVAARGYWGCTFDEGFHVTRGIVRSALGDTRLSYFHPPLENWLCGYFACLSYGDQLRYPDSQAWRIGDVQPYSVEFAATNRGVFPELIRASRWGATLLGVLLCWVGTVWAFRAGGVGAGWLAAAGLALNPCLLAHGNLSTTDVGVAAFLVAATYALWEYARGGDAANLAWAGLGFALAASTKYSGFMFLALFLAVCVPLAAWDRRDARLLAFVPGILLLFVVLLVWQYGPSVQTIRGNPDSWLFGKRLIAGRYVEGLFNQGGHSFQGQRAFFNGAQFELSQWWHLPATIALKNPLLWICGMPLAAAGFLFRKRSLRAWIPWIPFSVFAALLFTVNRLAIGVRHALPVIVFGILGLAVAVSRIPRATVRRTILGLLAASSWASAILAFPDFLSYFPAWSGGITRGHEWLVDSNYDWGQDIDLLESKWGALTKANGGREPTLVYFGFEDPRIVYGLRVGPHSSCGFMQRELERARGADAYQKWLAGLTEQSGTVIASISWLNLKPYGSDLSAVKNGEFVGRIGNSLFVYRLPDRAAGSR